MKRILVLQAGFIFIGNETSRTKTEVVYNNASCIRSWGTERGLGQIALSGPTKSTVLDPVGTLTAPLSAVLFEIDCQV